MDNFIEKIKSLKDSHRRLVAIFVVVLALSLPFVISQVLKQQDLRQHASTAEAITFNLSPAVKTIGINETFDADLVMNAGANDIGSLHFIMKYDPQIFQISVMGQSTNLQIVTQSNANGQFEATLLNPGVTPVTGNALKVVTFRFKALTTGTSAVTVDPAVQATATGYDTYVPVSNASSISASYSVATAITPQLSPTPTDGINPCTAATNRPDGCACTSSSQCMSSVCFIGPTPAGTPTVGSCVAAVSPTDTVSVTPINNQTDNLTPTPSPTITQIPDITLAQGQTGVKLSLSLPGIGNVNGYNPAPRRTRRTTMVTVYDSTEQNVVVPEKQGTLDYNATTGRYEGIVGIGTDITSGNYIVKVRMDNTLMKRLPGIIVITAGKTDNTTSQVELVTGDLDHNNDLGVQDYTNVLACFHNETACTGDIAILGDLDDDGVTTGDNDDISIMQYNTINRKGD